MGTRKLFGYLLCSALVMAIILIAIPTRLNANYYYMIDDKDYQAFEWMASSIPADNKKALVDPWKATAFVAITGKTVYTRMQSTISSSDRKAYDFLKNGCSDTDFLKIAGVSFVYTDEAVSNSDLIEVRKNVYLLRK
jgi:hypothetical protein